MDIKVKGPAPSQEVLAAISEKQVGMKKAFAENGPIWVANEFYAPNAWVFGGEDTWQGTEEILELYKSVCGAYTWAYESMNTIATSEDSVLDFIYGRIDSTSDDEVIEYKILFGWQKIDGDWKCITQMFAEGTW